MENFDEKLSENQQRLIDASNVAGQCRRNWTYEKFDDSDLHTITTVATNMPTKQNVLNYELVVSTNTQVNEKFYRVAFDKDVKFAPLNNGQVNAPLLYIWCKSPSADYIMQEKLQDHHLLNISVGISSGAAVLAATYLGYETGFCRCFLSNAVTNIIEQHTGIGNLSPILMLGVGHPKQNGKGKPIKRELCYLGDEQIKSARKYDHKKIKKIHYI